MSVTAPKLVIANGFDRSGTSAITRTLSQHPSVELFMQPFNGGPIRKLMYEVISDELLTSADQLFFQRLSEGKIERSYIKSDWFYKYSSTQEFIPGKLHLLKTTINHLTAPWLLDKYPEIPLWGIYRDPLHVLRSIFNNGFEIWYENSLPLIAKLINGNSLLKQSLGRFLGRELSVLDQVALNFSARTLHFFSVIPVSNLLNFEQFCENPNESLGKFVSDNHLETFDFEEYSSVDHNIIGKRDNSLRDDFFANHDTQLTIQILSPVYQLMTTRFGITSSFN